MEKVSWIQNGTMYRRVEGNVSNVEQIPAGIYNVNFNPMSGWSLERTGDKFTFDYKLYGLQTHFVEHVLTTFKNTKGNLGILLNGIKGTGKTVTAKVLANQIGLPIVIVKSFGDNNEGLIQYLASFNFDCVFFLDEFEKNWDPKDSSILQIMDGVYTSKYRRIFLLTTNETTINENLISRPSRLRYVKEFGNLEHDVVMDYLKDNLKDSECIDCVADFVDTLQISTIDILKTVVEDVNIHGLETFLANKDIFNVRTAEYNYSVNIVRFGNFDQVKETGYDTDVFFKDIKIFSTLKRPYQYMFGDDQEAYEKAMVEYRAALPKRRVDGNNICTDRSIRSLKIGDWFGSYCTEQVIKLELDRNIIVTKDDDDSITFYFVKNPNSKPSLAAANATYTNPYAQM